MIHKIICVLDLEFGVDTMPQGLQVFENNKVVLDITDRLTKYSGEVDIIPPQDSNPSVSGTISLPELVPSVGLWYAITAIYLSNVSEPILGELILPFIETSSTGGSFTWTYSGYGRRADVHIIYGVY